MPLYDESIKADANGNYVIAISRTADRPSNANAGCSKNWLQWSDAGDGRNDPNLGMVVLRNMLPDPSFPYSIQNNPVLPLNMGAYLPTVTYTSKSGFEALGCTSS